MSKCISIGDIGKSKFWATLEFKPLPYDPRLRFGKTYNGTKGGVLVTFWRFVFIAHMR